MSPPHYTRPMIRLFPTLLLLAACATTAEPEVCEPLAKVYADDEYLAGTNALEVAAALDGVSGEVPLVWADGQETTAQVEDLAVVLGTGRLHQRPDCIAACPTDYALGKACEPDQLSLAVTGYLSTSDGRLAREPLATEVLASVPTGPLAWSIQVARIPVEDLRGTFDPEDAGFDACTRGGEAGSDIQLAVWAFGEESALIGVDLGLVRTHEIAGQDAECIGDAGHTPRDR